MPLEELGTEVFTSIEADPGSESIIYLGATTRGDPLIFSISGPHVLTSFELRILSREIHR